jgi:hypothetical protein
MGEDPGEVGARRVDEDEGKTAEELRAEIEETREDLGETVEALAAKTDVKTRAREKADELKRSALTKKDELLSKAKRSDDDTARSPAGASGDGGSAVQQLKETAQQKPVETAAVGAFLGGLLLGQALGRRKPE